MEFSLGQNSQTLSPQPPRRLSGAPGGSWGLRIGFHQPFLRTRVREERVTPRDLLSICNCLPLGLPLFRAGIHAAGPWEAGEVTEGHNAGRAASPHSRLPTFTSSGKPSQIPLYAPASSGTFHGDLLPAMHSYAGPSAQSGAPLFFPVSPRTGHSARG